MAMLKDKPIGPSFRVGGFEPAEVKAAAPEVRLAFWAGVVPLVLAAKEAELAAGLDRFGRKMTRLARSTIENRRSAMGPADPHAPPLQPAHGLSRTRSLLEARATPSGVVCWWAKDPHTGESWGVVLGYHRKGSKRLPKRDVIGLSPRSRAEVQAKAAQWWAAHKAGIVRGAEKFRRTVYREGKPANTFGTNPAGKPRGVSELVHNGDHYTFGSGNASQVKRAVANGSFSGWKTAEEAHAEVSAYGFKYTPKGEVDWAEYFARNKPKAHPKPKPTPTAPARDFKPIPIADIPAWGEKHYGAWARTLTRSEFDAVEDYSGSSYDYINAYLRGQIKLKAKDVPKSIPDLDRALRSTPIPQDLTAFRGFDVRRYRTDPRAVPGVRKPADFKPGDVIRDLGYTSTSLDPEAIFKAGGEHAVILEIRVPKGTPGAFIGDVAIKREEWELLLAREVSKFRVVEVHPGRIVVEAITEEATGAK